MNAWLSLASLALVGPALAVSFRELLDVSNATSISNVTLQPVTMPSMDPGNSSTVTPAYNVSLCYGLDNNTDASLINVTLTTDYPSILLEYLDTVTSVDCSSSSVSMTFNSSDALEEVYSEWSGYDQLLLITNHVGDCDTEYDRGFFLATSLVEDTASLTLTATAEKTNITEVASYLTAQFGGLLAGASNTTVSNNATAKRDIVIDPDALTYSNTWDLPSTLLYDYDPYVAVSIDSGELSVSVTISGYLEFDIWSESLVALYAEFDTSVTSDLVLELAVNAPYNDTISYTPDALVYYIVNVPGIITLGPELLFSIGADLGVDAAVDIALDVGAEIDNGTLHIDFVNWNNTNATGWEPTYYANVNISDETTVTVNPFVSVTVELEFELLGGVLDLSGGVTPKVSFPTTVTLDAEGDVDAQSATNTTITKHASGTNQTCTNGAQVVSDFEFSLEAFVTEFWDEFVYNVTIAIADECYSWA